MILGSKLKILSMAPIYSSMQAFLRKFRWRLPPEAAHVHEPEVILLRGLGRDADDWTSPFQDRNWRFDYENNSGVRDFGLHSMPPQFQVPPLRKREYLSVRLESNHLGVMRHRVGTLSG